MSRSCRVTGGAANVKSRQQKARSSARQAQPRGASTERVLVAKSAFPRRPPPSRRSSSEVLCMRGARCAEFRHPVAWFTSMALNSVAACCIQHRNPGRGRRILLESVEPCKRVRCTVSIPRASAARAQSRSTGNSVLLTCRSPFVSAFDPRDSFGPCDPYSTCVILDFANAVT